MSFCLNLIWWWSYVLKCLEDACWGSFWQMANRAFWGDAENGTIRKTSKYQNIKISKSEKSSNHRKKKHVTIKSPSNQKGQDLVSIKSPKKSKSESHQNAVTIGDLHLIHAGGCQDHQVLILSRLLEDAAVPGWPSWSLGRSIGRILDSKYNTMYMIYIYI